MLEKIKYDPVKQEIIDPYSKDNSILTGFKGGDFVTSGGVYAPYIPMTYTYQHASSNSHGFVIERPGEDIDRYIYDPHRDGDLAAIDDIEEKGLVILDENEEEHWIDAIKPQSLADNIKNGECKSKLKATWTVESAQDLQAMYCIKAEEELEKMLAEYIKHEKGH